MRDDYLSADWARHHRSFTASVVKMVSRVAAGFARLQSRQFDAPWRPRPRPKPSHA